MWRPTYSSASLIAHRLPISSRDSPPCHGAVLDDFPLELGQSTRQVKHQPAAGGSSCGCSPAANGTRLPVHPRR